MDPDAPEDDEENEVEDADGDQEETDLLWGRFIVSLDVFLPYLTLETDHIDLAWKLPFLVII